MKSFGNFVSVFVVGILACALIGPAALSCLARPITHRSPEFFELRNRIHRFSEACQVPISLRYSDDDGDIYVEDARATWSLAMFRILEDSPKNPPTARLSVNCLTVVDHQVKSEQIQFSASKNSLKPIHGHESLHTVLAKRADPRLDNIAVISRDSFVTHDSALKELTIVINGKPTLVCVTPEDQVRLLGKFTGPFIQTVPQPNPVGFELVAKVVKNGKAVIKRIAFKSNEQIVLPGDTPVLLSNFVSH